MLFDPYAFVLFEELGKEAARGFFGVLDPYFDNPLAKEIGKIPTGNFPQGNIYVELLGLYQILQLFYVNFKADVIRIMGPYSK